MKSTVETSVGRRERLPHTWTGESACPIVAKAISRELPPVADVVQSIATEMTGRSADLSVDAEALEESVRDAVKSAIREVIEEAALSAAMIQFS